MYCGSHSLTMKTNIPTDTKNSPFHCFQIFNLFPNLQAGGQGCLAGTRYNWATEVEGRWRGAEVRVLVRARSSRRETAVPSKCAKGTRWSGTTVCVSFIRGFKGSWAGAVPRVKAGYKSYMQQLWNIYSYLTNRFSLRNMVLLNISATATQLSTDARNHKSVWGEGTMTVPQLSLWAVYQKLSTAQESFPPTLVWFLTLYKVMNCIIPLDMCIIILFIFQRPPSPLSSPSPSSVPFLFCCHRASINFLPSPHLFKFLPLLLQRHPGYCFLDTRESKYPVFIWVWLIFCLT